MLVAKYKNNTTHCSIMLLTIYTKAKWVAKFYRVFGEAYATVLVATEPTAKQIQSRKQSKIRGLK